MKRCLLPLLVLTACANTSGTGGFAAADVGAGDTTLIFDTLAKDTAKSDDTAKAEDSAVLDDGSAGSGTKDAGQATDSGAPDSATKPDSGSKPDSNSKPDTGSAPDVTQPDVQAPEICSNGVDDNSDGKTDCADAQCEATQECQAQSGGSCMTPAVLSDICGLTLSGSTVGGVSSFATYSTPASIKTASPCQATLNMTGPEKVYVITPSTSLKVTATFTPKADLRLILEETSGQCDEALCVREVKGTATWTLQAGKTYFYVVDGVDGASGGYQIAFACQ
jgi:hypothetical protein